MGRVHPEPPRHSAAGQLRPGEGRAAWGADETGNLVWSPLDRGQLCPSVTIPTVPSLVPGIQEVPNQCSLKESVAGVNKGHAGLYLNSFH